MSPSPLENQTKTEPAVTFDKNGKVHSPMSQETTNASFLTFINLMPGLWNSQRTYHYVSSEEQTVEPSQTTFQVDSINAKAIDKIIEQNEANTKDLQQWQLDNTYGFAVSFRTKMQSSDELVIASTNLAFVPYSYHDNGIVRGFYYRDMGYEERSPVKAEFHFDAVKLQLFMTTYYEKVVSCDSIQLINPSTRIRQIVNYRRSPDSSTLSDPALVGFGLETRCVNGERLVN